MASIDWENRSITVRHSRDDRMKILVAPKSNRVRHIPMDVDVYEMLFNRRRGTGHLGTNDQILNFARLLIARNMKTAAKELNRALAVLGNDVDRSVVINRISEKYLGEVAIGLAVQPTHRSGSHTILRA
jgi:hypothetical protein